MGLQANTGQRIKRIMPDIAQPEPAKKKSNHYVNNAELYRVLCIWKALYVEWEQKVVARCPVGKPGKHHEDDDEAVHPKKCKKCQAKKPPLPDYVAECLVKIARHLSYKPNFINYTFKEDMIGDALENCLLYIHNFKPERSTNAFAYITQIMHNAFIRRIQKESKQLYVKMKVIEQADMVGSYGRQQHDSNTYDNTYVTYLQENMGEIIQNFEERKRRKKKLKEKANLDAFFVDETDGSKTADGVGQSR